MAKYLLPRNYELLTSLGHGGFGEVVKCLKKDTNETVAVKIPQHGCSIDKELALLHLLKWKKLDQCNIVRFIDSFTLRDDRAAVAFEILDMTLWHYLVYKNNYNPLDLHHVRNIVQQMATALNALKTIEVIHSDIKLDNIMLVDHNAETLSVKLIDFGLALTTSSARPGQCHQTKHYRAPEITLGLPFSEAIDMWSLGIVMAFMVLGDVLFPGNSEYDVMRCIVELLGVPSDHLLDAGLYSRSYFVKKKSGHWRLKRPEEYFKETPPGDLRAYHFRNLDDVETLPLENLLMVEAEEKKECVDLLKAMLRMDPNERITPSEVLAHPFITRGTLHHSSDSTDTSEIPAGVILVRPAPPECCLRWDEDCVLPENSPVECHSEAERDLPSIFPEACNMEQEDTELSATTSDDMEPERKRVKKKNCFQRIISWTKRIFCCCISIDEED